MCASSRAETRARVRAHRKRSRGARFVTPTRPKAPPEAARSARALEPTHARADLSEALPPDPVGVRAARLAPGAVTLVAGYGYSRKTMAMQSLGLSVAAGKSAWGVWNVPPRARSSTSTTSRAGASRRSATSGSRAAWASSSASSPRRARSRACRASTSTRGHLRRAVQARRGRRASSSSTRSVRRSLARTRTAPRCVPTSTCSLA
jgi:hypothetical protein